MTVSIIAWNISTQTVIHMTLVAKALPFIHGIVIGNQGDSIAVYHDNKEDSFNIIMTIFEGCCERWPYIYRCARVSLNTDAIHAYADQIQRGHSL